MNPNSAVDPATMAQLIAAVKWMVFGGGLLLGIIVYCAFRSAR